MVTVEELADALWPEDKPTDQTNAVRSLMTRLRRVLPDGAVLTSTSGGYRLDVPPDAVDAARFDRLVREGRRALHSGDPETAARRLAEALALWRGPALADAPFAISYAAGLEEARLTAVEDRAEAELASGYPSGTASDRTYRQASGQASGPVSGEAYGSASGPVSGEGHGPAFGSASAQAFGVHGNLVAELSELAARHPLRERLHALLLKALYADGRQAEALAAYEEVRRRLADELGADPGPELRETHLAILRADPSLRPDPAARRRTTMGNLRTPLTSFVGREDEIRRVGDALEQARLVTLTGPGGAGKTRLATTVAEQAAKRFPGGVWLVELAGVTDPLDVPQAVLRVLDTGGMGSRTPADQGDTMSRLVEAIPHAQTMVVLDNCEHLVDAAASLADDLLGRCPQLRILATSRQPLGVFGETLCPVPPLQVPERGVSAVDAVAGPAVRLFADRAAAVRQGFEVTDGNVTVVVEICRRLDGLPLAIELASAWLRSLTAEKLAERLDDRFRLLTGGSRMALPRQQTLRAVVAWSWDLLDDHEREFAEEVAAFPAGITVEAAEWLGGSLDLLAALVDKSLLQMVEADEPRYRMLETIREYGLERLTESGRITKVRAAHAAYFLELTETAEPHLRGNDQLAWIARLDSERDNLLAALHFTVDSHDAETAIRLAAALVMFWRFRGFLPESVDWLRQALDVPGDAPPVARTLVTAMYLLKSASEGGNAGSDEIRDQFGSIVAVAVANPEHPMLALLEPFLCLITDDTVLGLEAIDRRLSHPDPWTRAMLRTLRGAILETEDIIGARSDRMLAVAEFREIGDRFGLSEALSSLAGSHLRLGDLDLAVDALEEAVHLMHELNAVDEAASLGIWLAHLRLAQGGVATARAELRAIMESAEREGSVMNVATARLVLGDVAREEGDHDEAATQYAAAAAVIDDAPFVPPQDRVLLLCSMAALAIARNDTPTAHRQIRQAIGYALEANAISALAGAAVASAALWAHCGEASAAARMVGAAERLRGASDPFDPEVTQLEGRLRRELGDAAYEAAHAQGRALDREAAMELLNNV